MKKINDLIFFFGCCYLTSVLVYAFAIIFWNRKYSLINGDGHKHIFSEGICSEKVIYPKNDRFNQSL